MGITTKEYHKGYQQGFKDAKKEYENRLKVDMVAMFTELQLEIEEKATEICDDGWWLTYNYLIQQKIEQLKEHNE